MNSIKTITDALVTKINQITILNAYFGIDDVTISPAAEIMWVGRRNEMNCDAQVHFFNIDISDSFGDQGITRATQRILEICDATGTNSIQAKLYADKSLGLSGVTLRIQEVSRIRTVRFQDGWRRVATIALEVRDG